MSALLQSLIYTAQRAGGAIMAVYATDFAVRDKVGRITSHCRR